MSGRLSGEFWNGVHDEVVREASEMYVRLVKELMASKSPPGAAPVPEHQEYLRLVEMRLKGDPMFTSSAMAQQRLAELEQKFGPAPQIPAVSPPEPQPMGVV